ncbi:MAG: hypothetical protein CUN55_14810 [Phototrophicales bacterium]|nr:MAG: hypothetical protein CUN55_14810 [Phototrophicales bacterium]
MKVLQYDHQDVRVVEFDGRMDATSTDDFIKVLQQAQHDGRYTVVMDMSKVNYMNSQTLHLLIQALKDNRDNGGDVRFAHLSPVVQRIFEIIGLRQQVKSYPSIETALKGI